MHKMRLGRSLASLIGEGEGSEDALKAGRFNPRRNFSILDSVDSGDVSLGSYYEDTLRVMLAVVWRQQATRLSNDRCGACDRYRSRARDAEAVYGGGLRARRFRRCRYLVRKSAASGGVVAVDASMLVETRSRLLQSQQLARRVVERLGLERIRPAVSEGLFSSWLSGGAKFYGDARAPGYPEDMAAKRLLRGLSVKTEPRSYLIAVRYTARDPELAALIANAFVAEFLQSSRTLSRAYSKRYRNISQRSAQSIQRY